MFSTQYQADKEAQKLLIITGLDHQSYITEDGYSVKPRVKKRIMPVNYATENESLRRRF